MATHHAQPNEVVDLKTWDMDMETEKSKAIFRIK
jgi:Trm5-related predicted tRNA methylase